MLRRFYSLRSPDDPQGGTPLDTPDTAPADDAGSDDEPVVFSQEQVGKLLAAERKKTRAAVLREKSAGKKTAQAPDKAADTPTAPDSSRMERMLDFRDAAGDHQIGRKIRKRLEREFLASGETDAESWLTDAVSDYGLVKSQPDSGADDKPKTPSPPTGPPASDVGGPAAPPDGAAISNPLRWDGQYVQSIIAGSKSSAQGVQEVKRRWIEGLKQFDVELPRGK